MESTESLQKLRVAILATDGVEEIELVEPKKALEKAGAATTVIAPKAGKLQAFHHLDKAGKISVDIDLEHAEPGEFDALLLPGGALNADALRAEPKAQKFVQEIDKAGKPMAVICHAPWLLVSAEVVKGRTLTSWGSIQDDVKNAGGLWSDQPVLVDRNLVTSRGPDDLPQFNEAMIRLFGAPPKSTETPRVADAALPRPSERVGGEGGPLADPL
jgi:protease I